MGSVLSKCQRASPSAEPDDEPPSRKKKDSHNGPAQRMTMADKQHNLSWGPFAFIRQVELPEDEASSVCQSLVIIVRFSLDVYEIIIDLTETSSRSRQHCAKKSGSTVLFISHFIGVDYELSALFENQENIESSVRKVHFSL